MSILRVVYMKYPEVVDDLPAHTIERDGKEVAAVLGCRGHPDLIVEDHRR